MTNEEGAGITIEFESMRCEPITREEQLELRRSRIYAAIAVRTKPQGTVVRFPRAVAARSEPVEALDWADGRRWDPERCAWVPVFDGRRSGA